MRDPTDNELVNIASGNGLVPSDNKPLSEPMLTTSKTHVAIWRYVTRPQLGSHFEVESMNIGVILL